MSGKRAVIVKSIDYNPESFCPFWQKADLELDSKPLPGARSPAGFGVFRFKSDQRQISEHGYP